MTLAVSVPNLFIAGGGFEWIGVVPLSLPSLLIPEVQLTCFNLHDVSIQFV